MNNYHAKSAALPTLSTKSAIVHQKTWLFACNLTFAAIRMVCQYRCTGTPNSATRVVVVAKDIHLIVARGIKKKDVSMSKVTFHKRVNWPHNLISQCQIHWPQVKSRTPWRVEWYNYSENKSISNGSTMVNRNVTDSSLIVCGFPICELKLRSNTKHIIQVLSRLCISISKAFPFCVSAETIVDFRWRLRSVAILSITLTSANLVGQSGRQKSLSLGRGENDINTMTIPTDLIPIPRSIHVLSISNLSTAPQPHRANKR